MQEANAAKARAAMANIDAQLMRLKGSFGKNAVTQLSEAQEKTGLSCKECQRLLR